MVHPSSLGAGPATVTLGTSRKQLIFQLEQGEENFYLLQLPPFCTESRPLRGTSRREVGHGNLVQRAPKR